MGPSSSILSKETEYIMIKHFQGDSNSDGNNVTQIADSAQRGNSIVPIAADHCETIN